MCYFPSSNLQMPTYNGYTAAKKITLAALCVLLFIAAVAGTIVGSFLWVSSHKAFQISTLVTGGAIAFSGSLFCVFVAMKINELLDDNPFRAELRVAPPSEIFKHKDAVQEKLQAMQPNNWNDTNDVATAFGVLQEALQQGLSAEVLLQHGFIEPQDFPRAQQVMKSLHRYKCQLALDPDAQLLVAQSFCIRSQEETTPLIHNYIPDPNPQAAMLGVFLRLFQPH